MYPLLESFQVVTLVALYLSRHYGFALINLLNDMMDHDSRSVVLQFSGLEIFKRSFNGMAAVIFAYSADIHPLV